MPAGVELRENILVARLDDGALHADLLLPAEAGPEPPVVVWLHGGGWRWGDRRTAFERLFRFVERGWVGVTLDYRSTDAAVFPAQLRDLQAGLEWLFGPDCGISLDPTRVLLFGGSAGAHLGLLAVLAAGDPQLGHRVGTRVAGMIAAFPPTELLTLDVFDEGIESQLEHSSADSCEGRLLGGAPGERAELARLASPLHHVHPEVPPLLLLHGLHDAIVPVGQSRALHAALQERGVHVQLRTYDGGHSAQGWPSGWLEDAVNWAEGVVQRR